MQYERLTMLRKKYRLSQETMAEIFKVSRQSIQKWESGKSTPDIKRLIEISNYFNVSLDFLLKKEDTRSVEQLRIDNDVIPHYKSMHEWELYSSALMTEYAQCIDEGKDISKYKNLFMEISSLPASKEKEELANVIFNIVKNAPDIDDYSYNEPSDLSSIKKMRQLSNIDLPETRDLENKIHGAWMGRIVGCLLGKPIEGISCEELTKLLKMTKNYPMNRYISTRDFYEDMQSEFVFDMKNRSFVDEIQWAPVDDDTNYTVMGMKLIEKYGRDFTSENVASMWIELQTKNAYCTAERVAFINFINGYMPPASAIYKNPYREWIGAQIRADYFGYINPGEPEKAAEMAWRDASISHVKNGIYGEMFVAAMLAAAAVLTDIKEIILCGLGEIPAGSRLYKQIMNIVNSYDNGVTQDEWFADFHLRYNDRNGYDWCHTISNAEIVVASLLYGGGDFSKSICMSVEQGFDTDCNGATVGSIVGMLKGISAIDPVWLQPINNTLDTSIFGVGKVSVDELVKETLRHIAF